MMAGTVLGVGSLTVVMAMNDGARAQLEEHLSEFGADMIRIRSGGGSMRGPGSSDATMTLGDAAAIDREIDGLEAVYPSYFAMDADVRHKEKSLRSMVSAVTGESMSDPFYDLDAGRHLAFQDEEVLARVALIGPAIAEEFFGSENPIGKRIQVNRVGFRVVGLFKPQGIHHHGFDLDTRVAIPLSTGMRRVFKVDYLTGISVKVSDETQIGMIEEQITQLLRKRHRILPGREDDFRTRTATGIMQFRLETTNTLSLLLGSLALLSLVVGGVVLMNIMLVAVGERTREIGLKRALGASARDILGQFLAESVAVSFLGMMLGTAMGTLVYLLLGWLTPDMAVVFSVRGLLLSLAFSGLVGIGFGTLPARKAAALTPVEALR
jgi:ABC-type antimicrobial peptide transport system permease subunit